MPILQSQRRKQHDPRHHGHRSRQPQAPDARYRDCPDTALASIEGFDDAARGGIAIDVENETNVDFTDDVVASWRSVRDIAASVLAQRGQVA